MISLLRWSLWESLHFRPQPLEPPTTFTDAVSRPASCRSPIDSGFRCEARSADGKRLLPSAPRAQAASARAFPGPRADGRRKGPRYLGGSEDLGCKGCAAGVAVFAPMT